MKMKIGRGYELTQVFEHISARASDQDGFKTSLGQIQLNGMGVATEVGRKGKKVQ
jgi:hypothetical protein